MSGPARELRIPIRPWQAITITVPQDTMSEADWAVLMAVLAAMKPALVEQIPDAQIVDNTDGEIALQHAREIAYYARFGAGEAPPWWRAGRDAWADYAAQLVRRYTEEDRA